MYKIMKYKWDTRVTNSDQFHRSNWKHMLLLLCQEAAQSVCKVNQAQSFLKAGNILCLSVKFLSQCSGKESKTVILSSWLVGESGQVVLSKPVILSSSLAGESGQVFLQEGN